MRMMPSYLTVLLTFFTALAAAQGATLDVRNGELYGAFDVNVSGTLYDVQFIDGTCSELFGGCDEATDFPFTNPDNLNDVVLIRAAMQALIDQVLIDSELGLFDSNPVLTNGCAQVGGSCSTMTPLFAQSDGTGIIGHGVINVAGSPEDVITAGGMGGDSLPLQWAPEDDHWVWAVWSLSSSSPDPSPVPEPATCMLFFSGILSLSFFGRLKKNNY